MIGVCRTLSSTCHLVFWLSLLIFLPLQSAMAASDERVAIIDEHTKVINLGKYAYYYEDGAGDLTYEQITKPEYKDKFAPIAGESVNMGFGDRVLWIKFYMLWQPKDVREINERQWIIEQTSPFIDQVEFFDEMPNGQLRVLKTGDKLQFGDREFDFPQHLFSTSALPYVKKTVYMRFKSRGAMRFELKARSLNYSIGAAGHHQLVMGMVLGLMLIMVIYNLSISFVLRDSLYLHFSIYIFAFLLCRMGVEGYLHQYLFNAGGVFIDKAVAFFGGIAMVFFIKFISKFLLQEKEMPWLRGGANFVLSLAIFATAMVYVLNEYYFVGLIMGWFALFVAVAAIIIPCYCWLKGMKVAKYFFFGNTLLIASVAFTVLLDSGFIQSNQVLAYAQYIGVVAQILLLSYALGQKMAEERLKRQEAQQKSLEYLGQYEDIYNNVADGLFRLNKELKIESANPALLGFAGCDSLQDYKDTFGDNAEGAFNDPEEFSAWVAMMLAMENNGQRANFEMKYNKKDGGSGWGLCTVKLVIDEKTQEKYYEGSFNDISDKKERELAEVARTKAEAIADAKGRFLATMSHEIRTPMNAIIGFTDIALSRGEMTEKVKGYFNRIRHSSDILLGVINDILDFSKIEAGMLELDKAQFLLKDVLKKVHDMFIEEAQEKKLGFEIDVDPEIPAILIGDQLRLSQIIINLVGNALKFTEQGKIEIRLTAQERRGGAMLIRFEVIDTGVGIKNPNDEYLFEAFTQADETTTREYGGSGLGLSICKKLIDLHGGSIGCESELGKGSNFWFEIDMESPELQSDRVEPFPELTGDLPRIDGKRVLVAEDNKIHQVIVMELLVDLGAEPVLKDDGVEALELLASEKVDLVLMDLHMPRMTGKEALKIIKGRGYKVPVVALSADAMDADAVDWGNAGFDGFISKPIDIDKFAVLLSNLLNEDAGLEVF